MNSLRVRIAAVLLGAITLVVCLATLVAIIVGRHNADGNFIRAIVTQVRYLGDLALTRPDHPLLQDSPVEGPARGDIAAMLEAALRREGKTWPVIVTQPDGAGQPFASVEIAPSQWLTLPILNTGPPPDAWVVLGEWMVLVLLGTAAISLAIAHRVTRPLVLLESVAARIGASGQLETVPESGPAEVRATARALNRLSGNLREAVESRMRLVAAAGHDLRTPLTRMRLRAEFLDDAERAKWLNNIDELERIADSAIALVREESGRHEGEEIHLDAMVRSIAEELIILRLDVTLRRVAPVRIKGPPLALTRGFRNLIINAATHGGGACLGVAEKDGRAVVTIEDDGPGIPEAMLGRVFEPFFRVDQGRRQAVPGAGLGLAIAREIIGRSGGNLSLRNKPGGGLRQTVSFPVARMDAPDSGSAVAPSRSD